MERWVNRVALVTGASSGIGAALCRELVKHGLKVVGCARSVDRIKAICEEPEVKKGPGCIHPVKCDLTKESDILAMFDFIRNNLGRLDVCINNAGGSTNSPLTDGKTEEWRFMLDVNVMALCICTREAIQLMKQKNIDDGQIINISSICGHVVLDLPGISFYTGTKYMVTALTEALRKDLRRENSSIRVCAISPGYVETEFADRMSKGDAEAKKQIVGDIKGLQAKDIACAVTSILHSPPHVDINDIIVRPVKQAT